MRLGTMCIALAILAASPVLAHAGRYELIPEPDLRQSFPQPGGGISRCHRQEGQPVLDLHGAIIFRTSSGTTAIVSGFRPMSAGPR